MIFTLNLRTLRPLRLCGRYSEFRLRLCRAGTFVVKYKFCALKIYEFRRTSDICQPGGEGTDQRASLAGRPGDSHAEPGAKRLVERQLVATRCRRALRSSHAGLAPCPVETLALVVRSSTGPVSAGSKRRL